VGVASGPRAQQPTCVRQAIKCVYCIHQSFSAIKCTSTQCCVVTIALWRGPQTRTPHRPATAEARERGPPLPMHCAGCMSCPCVMIPAQGGAGGPSAEASAWAASPSRARRRASAAQVSYRAQADGLRAAQGITAPVQVEKMQQGVGLGFEPKPRSPPRERPQPRGRPGPRRSPPPPRGRPAGRAPPRARRKRSRSRSGSRSSPSLSPDSSRRGPVTPVPHHHGGRSGWEHDQGSRQTLAACGPCAPCPQAACGAHTPTYLNRRTVLDSGEGGARVMKPYCAAHADCPPRRAPRRSRSLPQRAGLG